MQLLLAVRTFIASYVVPGWGFWIVGRRNRAVAVVLAVLAAIVLFSWTRLVIDPRGYITLVLLILALVFWAAIHSAFLEFRRDPENCPPRDWKGSLLFAAGAFAVLYSVLPFRAYTLGYEAFRIPARSMEPTLVVGDYIVADTWHYPDANIAIGQIVIFAAPGTGGVKYIKRVVGLPGDVLTHADEQLIRNGVAVDEPYAYYDQGPTRAAMSFSAVTVPNGEYFVLGDNRNNSYDSRYFGAVPKADFFGRAAHLWFSKDEQAGIQWQRFPNTID